MRRFLPFLAGAAGMVCVGGSVAVSGSLADAPLFTVQALRYAVAFVLLAVYARTRAVVVLRPRGREWAWLTGVAAAGMVLFNVALVEGSRHAEPAVLGVAVACVPPLFAVLAPALEGRSAAPAGLAAAVVVTIGAVLVQGFGRADAAGLGWAVVTFACEAGFTLLAVPVLGRHGPVGVSVHTTGLAAVLLALLGAAHEGPAAVTRLTGAELLAGGYLAVLVTAVAFVLWYGCVRRLGPGTAGLLTGIAPVSAALAGTALGGPAPQPLVWAGVATVAAGLALGLRHRDAASMTGPLRREAI
ncbi:DMT family transporter [Actinoplanes sp. N902-109]|uniref:DMT family transporter n=1 Tax=Actinoplanes sp. (strain N902-109) TaxID=649831 RepID=UPI0003294838|nr:DMT family transporter [Actinoplanes sp. N902-109]AGL17825.1 integral membrane protein [Actinoplanes sp. N902-109]